MLHSSITTPRHALNKSGFTLIEVLCYISLIGLVVGAALGVYALAAQNRLTRLAIAEVEEQGHDILWFISSRANAALAITTPLPGLPTSTLNLVMSDATKNPMIIELSSTTIRLKEGAGGWSTITAGGVRATNLLFSSTGSYLARPVVQVEFSLDHARLIPGNLGAYQATFYGAFNLRQ